MLFLGRKRKSLHGSRSLGGRIGDTVKANVSHVFMVPCGCLSLPVLQFSCCDERHARFGPGSALWRWLQAGRSRGWLARGACPVLHFTCESPAPRYSLCQCPGATETNGHEPSGLKEQKPIVSQLWRPRYLGPRCHRLVPSGCCRGREGDLLRVSLLDSGGAPPLLLLGL